MWHLFGMDRENQKTDDLDLRNHFEIPFQLIICK